jgi:predicted small integral membrane protein
MNNINIIGYTLIIAALTSTAWSVYYNRPIIFLVCIISILIGIVLYEYKTKNSNRRKA